MVDIYAEVQGWTLSGNLPYPGICLDMKKLMRVKQLASENFGKYVTEYLFVCVAISYAERLDIDSRHFDTIATTSQFSV